MLGNEFADNDKRVFARDQPVSTDDFNRLGLVRGYDTSRRVRCEEQYSAGTVVTPDAVAALLYASVTVQFFSDGYATLQFDMSGDRMVLDLDSSETSARVARAAVRDYSTEQGLDDAVVEAALVVTSELVSNAVHHGEAPITLCLERLGDGALRVEVCDAGDAIDRVQGVRSGELATSGRGLAIVAEFARDWRVERRADGKSVAADIADR